MVQKFERLLRWAGFPPFEILFLVTTMTNELGDDLGNLRSQVGTSQPCPAKSQKGQTPVQGVVRQLQIRFGIHGWLQWQGCNRSGFGFLKATRTYIDQMLLAWAPEEYPY